MVTIDLLTGNATGYSLSVEAQSLIIGCPTGETYEMKFEANLERDTNYPPQEFEDGASAIVITWVARPLVQVFIHRPCGDTAILYLDLDQVNEAFECIPA